MIASARDAGPLAEASKPWIWMPLPPGAFTIPRSLQAPVAVPFRFMLHVMLLKVRPPTLYEVGRALADAMEMKLATPAMRSFLNIRSFLFEKASQRVSSKQGAISLVGVISPVRVISPVGADSKIGAIEVNSGLSAV